MNFLIVTCSYILILAVTGNGLGEVFGFDAYYNVCSFEVTACFSGAGDESALSSEKARCFAKI